MITKQIACQLFAWGYKLVNKTGKTSYKISSVFDDCMFVSREDDASGLIRVNFDSIGSLFFILARSTDKLCEEIEGKVPFIDLFNILLGGIYDEENTSIKKHGGISKISTSIDELVYYHRNNHFGYRSIGEEGEEWYPPFDQQSLFNHLYSLHFAINLPEGTWKEI